jgi:hypothetical protein
MNGNHAIANLRTFCVAFALIFTVLGGGRLAIVFFVDPNERFVADPRHFTANRERWAKPTLVKIYPHNALLLGTSKLAHVNPDDIDTPKFRFFNAAVFGGNPEEIYTFIEQFAQNDKLVIISYDLLVMNESVFPWQPNAWKDPVWFSEANYDYLTASNIFHLALEYLWRRPASTPINDNGSRDVTHDLARSNAMPAVNFSGALDQIRNSGYNVFVYSELRVRALEKTAALLRERGTPHIVLISPENRQILELVKASGKQWALDRFRADIKRIFPDAIDYSDSWVSEDRNFFKFDPMHYLPAVGAGMVRDALRARRY